MAWPFSNNTGNIRDADAELSEERLKILSNVAIEQVPSGGRRAQRRGCMDDIPRTN